MDTDELQLEGRRLAGRYLLEEEIASGGMGTVWRGLDEVLGRPVAVKVLRDRLARDPDVLDRFRLEAVAAARLTHPAVVRVFDTGIDDGVCYIVMELFEGRTVERALGEDGPLDPREAARIVRAVLLGLGHAHREGVVHRDVKPGNILIDRNGFVKVSDFGIAKAAFAADDLTTTGNLLGTARYLAPEQVAGEAVDARADLYAAGLVLYEALTGRTPFQGTTHVATAMMRLTKDPVPPGGLRSGIPRELDQVVMRALAREPGARYQSAEEMGQALDQAVTGRERAASALRPDRQPAPAPTSTSVRSWVVVPLVVVVAAALAVGVIVVLERAIQEGGFGSGAGGGEPGSREQLAVAQAISHDPLGDGSEHDTEAPLAIDGDPATYWTTAGYTRADLGGLKEGVGLVVALQEPAEVGLLRLGTDSPGFTFSLFASDNADAFDLGAPLASDGETTFTAEDGLELELDPVETQYVLVWITELAQVDGYRAHLNEVALFAP